MLEGFVKKFLLIMLSFMGALGWAQEDSKSYLKIQNQYDYDIAILLTCDGRGDWQRQTLKARTTSKLPCCGEGQMTYAKFLDQEGEFLLPPHAVAEVIFVPPQVDTLGRSRQSLYPDYYPYVRNNPDSRIEQRPHYLPEPQVGFFLDILDVE